MLVYKKEISLNYLIDDLVHLSFLSSCNPIYFLQDFMQHMAAFASLPVSIKRQLCLKMVFAVVNEAGTIVMHNGERLDAWSVT